MNKITLFWNHICILHPKEKEILLNIKEELKEDNIDLDIHFFGLGYEYHMSEFLEKNNLKPDIVVSADLEVFEDKRIRHKLGELRDLNLFYKIKKTPLIQSITRDKLLPFVIIPLTCYTSKHIYNESILNNFGNIAVGGINNSALKTYVKTIWSNFSKDIAIEAIKKTKICDMPIEAFMMVKRGLAKSAICPSLYGIRSDSINTYHEFFKEGMFLLPSYVSVNNDSNFEIVKKVLDLLFESKLQEFYLNQGNLILCLDNDYHNELENNRKFMTYSNDFLKSLNPDEFYEVYNKIPNAYIPFKTNKNDD